ncbi:MAG: cytochrome c biogenesis protein ResB [Deltaproteobacteria bacterium]|nr:cytochrome c biogenesis protein ResB [Candidatus Zymogenaceae bacterium]
MSSIIKESLAYLRSVRFTVVVLILIAVVSAAGTLVGQNQSPEYYVSRFGHRGYHILTSLSITDIYHSVTFNALLLLLIINIILCTVAFAPRRLRAALSRTEPRYAPTVSETFSSEKDVGAITKTIRREMSRPSRRLAESSEGDTITVSVFPRPMFSLGAVIVHVSILLILLGGLLSFLFGFSGDMALREGSATDVIVFKNTAYSLDFSIRLNEFILEQYEDGTPKEYISNITFITDTETEDASIMVNHPAEFNGVRFYQISLWMDLERAIMEITSTDGTTLYSGDMFPLIPVSLSERDLLVMIVDYSPDLAGTGPAVHLFVQTSGGEYGLWVSLVEGAVEIPGSDGLYITLTDYFQVPYSGISAVRQPGLPFIWIGFILICIGFLFPLMGTGPRFKAVIEKSGEGSSSLTVSGAPGRISIGFDDAFHTLVHRIKDTLC